MFLAGPFIQSNIDQAGMDTKKSIDGIIEDLTNPEKSLEDALRKTLVLAHILKNDKLKTWVDWELNSYSNDAPVPDYRKVSIQIWGDVSGLRGSLKQRRNIHFQGATHPYLQKLHSGFSVTTNVAGLELVSRQTNIQTYLKFFLPPDTFETLEELYPGWTIEEAWIQASSFTITSVLSKIKNNLLQFLLTLNDELGNGNDFSIMDNSKKVDHLIERTIGHIHAENVTFGNNYQTKGNQNTVVQGNHNTQQNNSPEKLVEEVKALSNQIAELLSQVDEIKSETKQDITHQLHAVNSQVSRAEPNFKIVGKGLEIIEGLLLNVAATAYTPTIMGALEKLISRLNQ